MKRAALAPPSLSLRSTVWIETSKADSVPFDKRGQREAKGWRRLGQGIYHLEREHLLDPFNGLLDPFLSPSKGGPFSSEKSRYSDYIYIYISSLCDLVTEVQGRQTLFPKFSVTPVIMLSRFSSAERDIISQRGKLSRENSIIRDNQ